jgi:hypothetical protein
VFDVHGRSLTYLEFHSNKSELINTGGSFGFVSSSGPALANWMLFVRPNYDEGHHPSEQQEQL